MKKILNFLTAVAVIILISSCGASRKVINSTMQHQAPNNGLGVEIAKSPAQQYAEDLTATTLRGYGSYNSLPGMQGMVYATNIARQDLVNSIETFVQSAVSNYSEQYLRQNLSDSNLQKVMEGVSKAGTSVKSVAERLVANTPPVVRNSYTQPDGSVTDHVCVELAPSRIIEALASDNEFKEVIGQEAQLYIDWKSKEFDKSMESAFEEMRKAKNEK